MQPHAKRIISGPSGLGLRPAVHEFLVVTICWSSLHSPSRTESGAAFSWFYEMPDCKPRQHFHTAQAIVTPTSLQGISVWECMHFYGLLYVQPHLYIIFHILICYFEHIYCILYGIIYTVFIYIRYYTRYYIYIRFIFIYIRYFLRYYIYTAFIFVYIKKYKLIYIQFICVYILYVNIKWLIYASKILVFSLPFFSLVQRETIHKWNKHTDLKKNQKILGIRTFSRKDVRLQWYKQVVAVSLTPK